MHGGQRVQRHNDLCPRELGNRVNKLPVVGDGLVDETTAVQIDDGAIVDGPPVEVEHLVALNELLV